MPKKDPMTAQRDLLRRVQSEGLEVAYDALVAVCKDPKAPAPAKATAGAALFRAGGAFDKDAQRGNAKPPEEMAAEEISARLAELRAQQAEFLAGAQDAELIGPEEDEDGDTEGPDEEDDPKDPFG